MPFLTPPSSLFGRRASNAKSRNRALAQTLDELNIKETLPYVLHVIYLNMYSAWA